MQRAKRRLTCSRASSSSISNGAARLRRSSRTSSAGGDCIAISRDSNRFADVSDSKIKLQNAKYKARTTLSNMKNNKKRKFKAARSQRPTFGSLQNAVVLAPFYTLKRSFQTKLVDLYSQEKSKKLNNKMKMAKKKNLSFEYDVLEVKPPANASGKKDAAKKKKAAAVKRKRKRDANAKSQIYCDCESSKSASKGRSNSGIKTNSKNSKMTKRNIKNKMETPGPAEEPTSPIFHYPLAVFDNHGQKKRRFDNQMLEAPLLKSGLALKYSKSNGNLHEGTSNSFSNVSSKGDSWETFSDSLSFKEERLEGSLAISTTSFDSCLEQSSYDGLEPIPGRSKRSRYNTRMRMFEAMKANIWERPADFPPKPNIHESRHLIMNDEPRNSDNRIDDFLDREPQSQGIRCRDIPETLQPLPRRSKTKAKKQSSVTPPATSNYYLRSFTDNVEDKGINTCQNLNFGTAEAQVERIQASTSQRFFEEELTRRRQSQNATESENALETGAKTSLEVNSTSEKQDKKTHLLFQSHAKSVEESYSQTEEIFGSSDWTSNKFTTQGQVIEKESNDQAIHGSQNRKSNTVTSDRENHQNNQTNSCSTVTENESHQNKTTNDYGKPSGSAFRLPVEELMATAIPETATTTTTATIARNMFVGVNDPSRYLGSPAIERTSSRFRDPQDKEPSFIFGPRSTSARLGESCEFAFGLKWVLSDEEDSDHGGDRFF